MAASCLAMAARCPSASSCSLLFRAAFALMPSSSASSSSSSPINAFSYSAWDDIAPASTSACFSSPSPAALRIAPHFDAFRRRCVHRTWLHNQACSLSVASSKGSAIGTETSSAMDREILVQHLLVKEDQLSVLLDLQRKIIQEGADLSDLAEEFSVCPSKSEGGMLGWISKGQLEPEFEEAAFKAPLNKLLRVKTKHGWHLLQVLSERDASVLVEIQPEELHMLLQDIHFREKAQCIDVRELDEMAIAAIEGFEPYPLSQFGRWGPTITEDLEPAKDTYVLCHHGVRSMQAAIWLKSQGFKRLFNVAGGIHAYATRADQSIPKY